MEIILRILSKYAEYLISEYTIMLSILGMFVLLLIYLDKKVVEKK